MKKLLALLLAVMTILCLCACGAKTEEPAPAEAAPAVEETDDSETDVPEVPTAADSSSDVVVAPAAAAEESSVDEEMFATAEECIGLNVSDLYAAIGEPDSSEYSSSCLVEDAEDGVLYYNAYGFYVYSLKESDGTETVQAILEL